MKRLAVVCAVVLVGCDWDEAERQARCTNGDSSACPDGGVLVDAGTSDAGTPDAGTSDAGTPDAGAPDAGAPDAGTPDAGTPDAGTPDAGTPDAGTPDAGTPDAGTVNPNHPVAPRRELVGLFPRGDAGAMWLVLRSGEVLLLDRDGDLAGTVRFAGEVIDAYADGVAQPLLGVLVDGGEDVVLYNELDGGRSVPDAAVPGRWVTTFFNGTEAFGSVWNNVNGDYLQTIVSEVRAPSLFSSMTGCVFELADLQVTRIDEGARVLLAYRSGSDCAGIPNLPGDAGLAFITNTGAWGLLTLGQFHRLGRLEGEMERGLVAATVLPGERAVQHQTFTWSVADQEHLAARGVWAVSADAGLTLGDVSGNVVSGVAYGPLTGPFAAPAGFVEGTPTAFVASERWAVALGPTLASSHVPVLRIDSRVFAAWLQPDGGVGITVLNALDGGR